MKSIDLNADMGEGMPFDQELLKLVTSVSIACGGHAGDQQTMETTLLGAKDAGVRAGAHPGFLDRQNFGRFELDLPAKTLAIQVVAQVDVISRIASDLNHPIAYIKLHGAMYNMASENYQFARSIFLAIKASHPRLAIMAMAGSAQIGAAQELGLGVITEAFADRAYDRTGHLRPRSESGAVFADPALALTQAIGIAERGEVRLDENVVIKCKAQSICLHGDNSAALAIARAVHDGLVKQGMEISA